ncbi:DUF4003 family protein [Clostridium aminobutyricum]|uniref:DUF4003 domain-containing protein n=1 Tax=Clostridium aminobutyricum TaxID=33953 RepID=A0A939II83_CLOAM|nr:DUF4003 family protein [Clostridium aminobutyricum]MBN7772303.1 DUF4003 domain-containing protein [Clostridium aminobutyricum]
MRNTLSTLCENFIENRETIKATFRWESTELYSICAALFTDKRQKADANKMIYCRDIFKSQVGLFSNFRGTIKLVMICMMAIDSKPEQKLKRTLDAYSVLKGHFFSSEYLPLTSMIISDLVSSDRYNNIAERTRHIYKLMKDAHPFLTSSEDSVFAALLAISDLTDEQIVMETKCCYDFLKPEFFSRDAVQSLSHVLALGEGKAEDKCRKTIALFNSLKEKGYRYGKNEELATLGVLAMLPADSDSVINDVIEVDNYLSAQKGYGLFGIDKKQRLMHAGMLVASDYIDNPNNLTMGSAAIGATISLIVAQQAAMCAVIAASSVSASSSSSS